MAIPLSPQTSGAYFWIMQRGKHVVVTGGSSGQHFPEKLEELEYISRPAFGRIFGARGCFI